MFEVNLLNKNGLQYKEKKIKKVFKEEYFKSHQDSDKTIIHNRLNLKYFYYFMPILVLSLFAYVFIKSNNKYKTNYKDIYPGNILSILDVNTEKNKIFAIESTASSFEIIKDISGNSDIYTEQALCDSIFNISSYISVDRGDEKLYLNFNWYLDTQNNSWSIKRLYESLNSENSLTARIELFQNNVILVANYNELINLFNILKRLKIDHSFSYDIELFKKGVKSKNNYYKVLISNND